MELLSFIRGEQKFSGVSELKAQMLADMEVAKQRIFGQKLICQDILLDNDADMV